MNVSDVMEPSATFRSTDKLAISVAMATYNGARFIEEQLQSLAKQTHLPCELIVTDDGSSDHTVEFVLDFARTAPFPVRVEQNASRLGFADNFLKAGQLCTGDCVAFCDQDDVWLPKKLEKCAEKLRSPEVMVCVHSADTWSIDGRIGYRHPDFSKSVFLDVNKNNPLLCFSGFAMIFRRRILDIADNSLRLRTVHSLGGAPLKMGHDEWVMFLGASVGGVYMMQESLALYRQHDANTHGAPKKSTLGRQIALSYAQRDYSSLSVLEGECADFLQNLNSITASYEVQRLNISIRKFRARAELHRRRAMIYEPGSTIFFRAYNFLIIFLTLGYVPGKSSIRLGIRAAVKDLVVGVSGMQKA